METRPTSSFFPTALDRPKPCSCYAATRHGKRRPALLLQIPYEVLDLSIPLKYVHKYVHLFVSAPKVKSLKSLRSYCLRSRCVLGVRAEKCESIDVLQLPGSVHSQDMAA